MTADLDIRVVNRHHKKKPAEGVTRIFCGRPSPLGNPFEIGKHGDRPEVIESFRRDVWKRIKRGDAQLIAALNSVHQAAMKGPVELECFCNPAPCHCDVIRSVVEWRHAGSKGLQ